ncbi:hypothetical protein N802_06140 [Knoellia sinensis KCTC 19936]|uniref:ATP-dependent dethiobiotin synthetase BioD n=1 Tax=Knoellia sinensis KCTC 19936 TaxID=1385520 RepID=A0A0A0J008_9MICO|nr:dethiobiotin synthase [Knoellia sinensis]KGN30785.1 hypothetical protein N802_06140 [Knoellia sinensis KCTC 19936]
MTGHGFRRFVVVTGTDTGVGKTIATAALASMVAATGATVTVDKPTQTGVLPGEDGDIEDVLRLSGVRGTEGVRLREPMAPVQAAALESRTLPALVDHLGRLRQLAARHDHVIVEGAGGLLVPLTSAGETLADLAGVLGPDAEVVVVARAGLGTLNHTLLTLEALTARGLHTRGTLIGSWPDHPDAVDLGNQEFLAALDAPLLARIPARAGHLDRADFVHRAPLWFAGGGVGEAGGTGATPVTTSSTRWRRG